MYSSASDLSNPEIQILELTRKNDGPNDAPMDVLNKIYKQLDPLESAMVLLARTAKKDLRRDHFGKQYQITHGSKMEVIDEVGPCEIYDTLAEIKRLENDKITVTTGKGVVDRKTKTYNLDEFINKTREIILEKLDHQKIHQSVLKINPQLGANIRFSRDNDLEKFEYLDNNSTDFMSYLVSGDSTGNSSFSSDQIILEIYPKNKFKFKHIDEQLTFEELSIEIERMKKISELTKIAEDLSKNAFTDCVTKRKPNPSNPLLPIVLITKDQDSYVINNDSVTIKISGKEEVVKSLEEFVTNFQEIIPSKYTGTARVAEEFVTNFQETAPSNYPGTPRVVRVIQKDPEVEKS